MPSNKPKIQILVRNQTIEKFKEIAKKEERSISQLGTIAIEKYIKQYEAEHGEIIIESKTPNTRMGGVIWNKSGYTLIILHTATSRTKEGAAFAVRLLAVFFCKKIIPHLRGVLATKTKESKVKLSEKKQRSGETNCQINSKSGTEIIR